MIRTATIAAVAIIGLWPTPAQEAEPPETTITYLGARIEEVIETEDPLPLQTPEREAWLRRLEQCESGGNPNALNPEDLDGTPSHGILQFKRSTFIAYSRKYHIIGELYEPEAQRAIVREMMDDPSVWWEQQFPACVRKLGRPPGT